MKPFTQSWEPGHRCFNPPYWSKEHAAAAAAKSLQSCPTLCDPIASSPPGSPVPGILQARTLEWVAISFSNAAKWKVKVKWLSHVRLLATPWTAAHQAPVSMGFFRQECWSGVTLPSPSGQSSWSQLTCQPGRHCLHGSVSAVQSRVRVRNKPVSRQAKDKLIEVE